MPAAMDGALAPEVRVLPLPQRLKPIHTQILAAPLTRCATLYTKGESASGRAVLGLSDLPTGEWSWPAVADILGWRLDRRSFAHRRNGRLRLGGRPVGQRHGQYHDIHPPVELPPLAVGVAGDRVELGIARGRQPVRRDAVLLDQHL